MDKYNYVFFWHNADYYRYAFSEILNLDNVRFISEPIPEKRWLMRTLHRLHNSSKINNIVKLPFRKLWRNIYFNNDFENDLPIVFVFHGEYYRMRSVDYFSYLKKKYRNCKCVIFLMDTVERYKRSFKGKFCGDYDVEYMKDLFDMVLSYNLEDVEEYGLTYYPSIYSSIDMEKAPIKSDVFFVGRAKDRLPLLHSIYLQLVRLGLRCDFYITKVQDDEMLQGSDIHYNCKLLYRQVLEHINSSNAVLEIVQGGSNGFTFRLDEALVFDKVLLTNNPIVDRIPYANSGKIIRVSETIDLTRDEFARRCEESFHYRGDYSPKHFLAFLKQNLA